MSSDDMGRITMDSGGIQDNIVTGDGRNVEVATEHNVTTPSFNNNDDNNNNERNEDEELFEIIDFTSVSPFERFISSLEATLRQWGLQDGSLGVFSPTSTNKSAPLFSSSSPAIVQDIIMWDHVPFVLSYHYLPLTNPGLSGLHPRGVYTMISLPNAIPNPSLPTPSTPLPAHTLHRHTLHSHLLTCVPLDLYHLIESPHAFSSGRRSASPSRMDGGDLDSTKMLMSSLIIALQSIHCSVPVFIPQPPTWKSTWRGYKSGLQASLIIPMNIDNTALSTNVGLGDVECRYEMMYGPYVPPQYNGLGGIVNLFLEKMGLEHRGNLMNPVYVSTFTTHALFMDRQSINRDSHGWQVHTSKVSSCRHLPKLPFGPTRNPLYSITLHLLFPTTELSIIERDEDFFLDPMNAFKWYLAADYFSSTRSGGSSSTQSSRKSRSTYSGRRLVYHLAKTLRSHVTSSSPSASSSSSSDAPKMILTNILIRYTQSLLDALLSKPQSNDVANQEGSSSGSSMNAKGLSDRVGQVLVQAVAGTDGGTVGSGSGIPGALTDTNSSNANQPLSFDSTWIVDEDDILDALKSTFTVSATSITLPSVPLFDRLTKAMPIAPVGSLLWNLTYHFLNVVSPLGSLRFHGTTLLGFTRAIWKEIMKEVRRAWYEGLLLPNIDISQCIHSGNNDGAGSNSNDGGGIDLRSCLVHQKLIFLNCCIYRKVKDAEDISNPVDLGVLDSGRIMAERVREHELAAVSDDVNSNLVNTNTAATGDEIEGMVGVGARAVRNLFDQFTTTTTSSAPSQSAFDSLLEHLSGEQSGRNHMQGGEQLKKEWDDWDDWDDASSKQVDPASDIAVVNDKMESMEIQQSERKVETETEEEEGDDVFYDTIEEFDLALRNTNNNSYRSRSQSPSKLRGDGNEEIVETPVGQFEGRLRVLKSSVDNNGLGGGKEIWIPITQEPGFMTEDMVREQEQDFERLGTGAEAAKLRAKLQCAHLISDMEAFKAANVDATLEDFVMWHSPRDLVKKEDGTVGLSGRMSEANNLWVELWKTARRVPVSRQRPLFDHEAEGLKAIEWLENLSPERLLHALLPTVCFISYFICHNESETMAPHIRDLAQGLERFGKTLVSIPWSSGGLAGLEETMDVVECVVQDLKSVEETFGIVRGLSQMLPEQYRLIQELLNSESIGDHRVEIDAKNLDEKDVLLDLFLGRDSGTLLAAPTSKEFLLEMMDGEFVRREYALLRDGEFRVVDTSCKNVAFC